MLLQVSKHENVNREIREIGGIEINEAEMFPLLPSNLIVSYTRLNKER